MERTRGEEDDAPRGPGRSATDRRRLAVIAAAIGGLLAGIVTVTVNRVRGALAEARVLKARYELHGLRDAVAMYREVKGRLPGRLEALAEPDCYGPFDPALDPWGRPYAYAVEGRDRAVIRTLGADGLPGGTAEDADIAVLVTAPPAVRR